MVLPGFVHCSRRRPGVGCGVVNLASGRGREVSAHLGETSRHQDAAIGQQGAGVVVARDDHRAGGAGAGRLGQPGGEGESDRGESEAEAVAAWSW